jgi:peptide chain release factor 2
VEQNLNKIKKLNEEMSAPDFWSNRENADKKIKELGELQDLVGDFNEIETGIENLTKEFDENKFIELKNKFIELEIKSLFTGKYDSQSAVISIFPGAGGDDAEDWARMLMSMYDNFAKLKKWKIKIIDDSPRSRVFEVIGKYAYGYLKKESGVHRLVRISPFNAKHTRETSFALVEVVPELPDIEESKIQIPESDLKIEFYRSSGPGGQNVNKVETAVRIVHIPTGISVTSQIERSQAQNREYALKLLKAKLFSLMEKEKVDELGKLRTKVKPEWGNQIRSYTLNPYQLVKDHRTDVETSRVDDVLLGDIDIFIEAELEEK